MLIIKIDEQQIVLPLLRRLIDPNLGISVNHLYTLRARYFKKGLAHGRDIGVDFDHIHMASRHMLMTKPYHPPCTKTQNGNAFYCLRALDRKSTRLNSSHVAISYAVFCLKKKT